MKVKGCIKQLSEEWRAIAKTDYILFIERGKNDIVSTFVSDDIFPDEHNIQVDDNYKKLLFEEIEINDIGNWHKKKEAPKKSFKSITDLLTSKEANKTYTPTHSY